MLQSIDYHAIAPEIVLGGTALLVLIVDLFLAPARKWLAMPLSLFGVLGALAAPARDLVGLGTVLLILVCGRTGWLARFGGGAPMQWLGLISYSLYLTHNTVTGAAFRIGYRLTGRSVATEALWLALVTVACCVFAWLFYLVFERAGLRWSKLVPLHRPAAPAAAAMPLPVRPGA